MSSARRYAVLIGSSRFDNEPKMIPLKAPERDVDAMREILAAPELGAFDETFVLKNAENHAAMRRIEDVLGGATSNDQVLIYYSGHGETDLPGRLYLATSNTEVRSLVSTSIPIETLKLLIENSSCRRIMLILDCCYGGAAGRSFARGAVDEKLKDLTRGSGVYILTASTASQTAHEREGDEYGLLTKHIITGIRQGEADLNDDGFVSMDDLYGYVLRKVRGEGHQEPMRWALNVKGEDLMIAWAAGSPGRQRRRQLSERIIEVRDSLPRQVFRKALQVIDDRQEPYYGLVEDLFHRRLQVGEFIEEWYRAGSAGQPQDSLLGPDEAEISEGERQSEKPEKVEVKEQRRLETESARPPAQERRGGVPQPRREEPQLQTPYSTSQAQPENHPGAVAATTHGVTEAGAGGSRSRLAALVVQHKRRLITASSTMAVATVVWLMEMSFVIIAPPRHVIRLERATFETVTLDATGKESQRQTLQAEYFREPLGDGVALEMVKIDAGEFSMGSLRSEDGHDADEEQQHKVRVSEFFIGRCEVTREQWRQVARLPKVEIDLKEDPSHFKDSWKQPVENVSWYDAVEFCARLQQKTGRVYRLPSEAEWEYAARAGTTTPFAFGPTITPAIVNYPYGSAPKGEYHRKKTIEVGSLGVANGFGLYDMHGNVWEWCEDVYHDSYGGKHGAPPADGSAWTTGGEEGIRVLRGGSWDDGGVNCRSAHRVSGAADIRYYSIGFRVVYGPRTQ